MKKNILILVAIFMCSVALAQQNTSDDTSSLEDDLFGSSDDVLLTQEETQSENLKGTSLKGDLDTVSLMLESEKLRIGGSLSSGLGLTYSWSDPYSKKDDYWKSFTNPQTALLNTNLNASLFFDARPTDNSKIYGKFLFGFPFEKTLAGNVVLDLPGPFNNIPIEVPGAPNFKIHELYTDFSAKDIAFFRFGKHTVKWGTGLFYSPADVLNISRIDPQDLDADREGPVSLRAHIIIPKTQHNLWFYLLPDTKEFKPQYTAFAAKADLVFGSWELGIGGWYRYEKAPRIMTTLSGSIAGKVSVFAEGVFAWGSDYTYNKNDAKFSAYEEKNKPFFQATAGGSYTIEKSHTTFLLQYYYNGFGYKKPSDLATAAFGIWQNKTLSLEEKQYAGLALQNLMQMGQQPGQHYIAFTVSQHKLGTDKLSLSLFQQFAISELEGLSSLTLNWNIYRFASMNVGPMFTYPLSPKSNSKGSIGFNLGFTLGGGRF